MTVRPNNPAVSDQGQPLEIDTVLEMAKFSGFNPEGTSYAGALRLRMQYSDPRTMIDDGEYSYRK